MQAALTNNVAVTRICGQRDQAVSMMDKAIDLIERGHALAQTARETAAEAAEGSVFHMADKHDYDRLFLRFDPTSSAEGFRHHTDAGIWQHLLEATGMKALMDATALDEFLAELKRSPAPVTEDNVLATLEGLAGDAKLIFARGLARAFSDLDRRFRSHDAFQIGSRMVITRCFDGCGDWNYHKQAKKTIADVERVLAVLDGHAPQPGELADAINESRPGWGPRQGVAETQYLKIRTYKNGHAHLWFKRPDLVKKANLVLADYYGAVLPDAVPDEADNLRSKTGLPSKNLAFYATPEKVVEELLSKLYLHEGSKVLEPSAGTGNIVRGLEAKGHYVTAIEIDPERANKTRRTTSATVVTANFLQTVPEPIYDAVVSNPPFAGTHWIEHVIAAMDWLKPSGVLRVVLPVTAQVGTSKKHKAFRRWALQHSCHNRLDFTELPAESFASSGTRVNTTILTLHRGP